jgi:hypothetical protein
VLSVLVSRAFFLYEPLINSEIDRRVRRAHRKKTGKRLIHGAHGAPYINFLSLYPLILPFSRSTQKAGIKEKGFIVCTAVDVFHV